MPECTLNPEELERPYLIDYGTVYDIRGQELFSLPEGYYVVSIWGDYAIISDYEKQGLVTLNGETVLPVEYDEFETYGRQPFADGYVGAIKDGMFDYLDIQGQSTCGFVYPEDAIDDIYPTLAKMENEDGSYTVISSVAGELPEHYSYVSAPSYIGCKAFVAEKEDDTTGVVEFQADDIRLEFDPVPMAPKGSRCSVSVPIDRCPDGKLRRGDKVFLWVDAA